MMNESILATEEEPDLGPDRVHALWKTLREYSLLFSKIFWFVSLYAVAILVVLVLVFALSSSTTLYWDRRILLSGIVGVVLLSSVGVLFLSRKEGKLLIVVCVAVAHITGIALGLCTWYL